MMVLLTQTALMIWRDSLMAGWSASQTHLESWKAGMMVVSKLRGSLRAGC